MTFHQGKSLSPTTAAEGVTINSSSPHSDCGLANRIILLGTLTLAGGSDTKTQTRLGSCPQWLQWVKSPKAVAFSAWGLGGVAVAAAAPSWMVLVITLADVLLA